MDRRAYWVAASPNRASRVIISSKLDALLWLLGRNVDINKLSNHLKHIAIYALLLASLRTEYARATPDLSTRMALLEALLDSLEDADGFIRRHHVLLETAVKCANTRPLQALLDRVLISNSSKSGVEDREGFLDSPLNSGDWTLLMFAAQHDHLIDPLRLLLQRGADVSRRIAVHDGIDAPLLVAIDAGNYYGPA